MTRKAVMPKSAKQYVAAYEAIWEKADADGRDLTPGERGEVEGLVEAAKSQASIDKQIAAINGDGSAKYGRGIEMATAGGPGDRFIESTGYKAISNPDSRASKFSSGAVEVSEVPLSRKGTLLESGAGGPGGGLTPAQYESGVVAKLFQPLGVADLFGQSQTTASQMRYVNEGTATSGAAGVAEGGEKPQSTFAYSEVSEPIKKIATSLIVSDEMLEDAASIQAYLNSRLSLFVNIEEERQLLRGGGTNELAGLIGRSGVNVLTKGTADNNAVGLLKAAAGVRGSAFLEPDAVIMHPENWLTTRLLRDSAGQFLGGGPFMGAYGNAAQVGTSQFSSPPLWGLRVVTSTTVGKGTAVLGSFQQGAHIWRRGGVTVEATNSHEDNFVHNLTALRAEERLGLGVFRPSSFVVVSGLE